MLIDFTKVLTDFDDKPIPRDKESDQITTLAFVCEMALLSNTPVTSALPADKKLHRAVLAQDIHRNSKVDMIVEDIAMLKEAIAAIYPPLIILRAYEILDPKIEAVASAKH